MHGEHRQSLGDRATPTSQLASRQPLTRGDPGGARRGASGGASGAGGVHRADCSPPGDPRMAIGLDPLSSGPHQSSAHHTAAAARAMEAAWPLPACQLWQGRQGSGRAAVPAERTSRCDVLLAASATAGLGRGVPRLPQGMFLGHASPPPSVAAATRPKSSA